MVPAVYIRLPPVTNEALVKLANAELRDPRLQARLLVEDGLRQRGLLRPLCPETPELNDKEAGDASTQ